MSVFGVDFGNLNCVVAVTRNGGVDVIINEVSKRETSAFVSLTDQERCIGESGLDRYVRNASNTVAGVKRWIGARMDDPDLALNKRFLSCKTTGDADGRLMFGVMYNGEEIDLYPEQVLAMLLTQLKTYVDREAGIDVRDCVLTVPCYYTAEQRRLMVQACEMAGVNAMSLVNDTTAAAIDYGIFRGSSLPEKESDAQVVAILDIGYGETSFAVSAFWRGNMKVLARVYDKHLGTREIDYVLFEHFSAEIQKKYGVDPKSNKRATIRLLQGCERVKYLLSGNQVAPLNIENLLDHDVAFNGFQRSDLEALSVPLLERLAALLKRGLAESGVTIDKVHSVEIIGGGCRIPMFKRTVEEALGKAPSFTLNASESAARGAAITAAVFSPKFQVREFVVQELTHVPVKLGYFLEGAASVSSVPALPSVNKVVTLLAKGDHYPKTLEVTIKRSDAFKVYAFYDDETIARPVIGEWDVSAPEKATTTGEVKLRVKFLASGLIVIDLATATEVFEVEETEEKKDPANPDAPPEKVTVKKQKQRRLELNVVPNVHLLGHAPETIVRGRKLESDMAARDAMLARTKEAKNALEAYILDNRTHAGDGGAWAAFMTPEDQKTFLTLCNDLEQWLYDEGSDSTLDDYLSRLGKLKAIGAPAAQRLRLSEDLPYALSQFVAKAQALRDLAIGAIGKKEHITADELNAAAAKVEAAIAWATSELAAAQALPKTQTPTLTPAAFDAKLKEIDVAVKAVINKPVPPPPKKEASPPPAGAGSQPASGAGASSAPPPPPAANEDESPASGASGPAPPQDLD